MCREPFFSSSDAIIPFGVTQNRIELAHHGAQFTIFSLRVLINLKLNIHEYSVEERDGSEGVDWCIQLARANKIKRFLYSIVFILYTNEY